MSASPSAAPTDRPPLPTAGAPPAARRITAHHGLLALVVVAVLALGWYRRWTSDDAFINFRVVHELLAGYLDLLFEV